MGIRGAVDQDSRDSILNLFCFHSKKTHQIFSIVVSIIQFCLTEKTQAFLSPEQKKEPVAKG